MSKNSERYNNCATGAEPCSNNCSQSEAYENLRNAIILQAVYDYRKALKKLVKNPENQTAIGTITEVESFFRSKWYRELTSIDGEMIIEKLKSEV